MTAAHAELRGRRATVMGLGLQGGGVEVARYLAALGARVTVTDVRPEAQLMESVRALAGLELRFVLGEHREEDFAQSDLVVANPAVPPAHPMLALARDAGVRVASECELFLEACPARVVAVTGTQGKSSTCSATAGLLESAGMRVHLGGNIGRSLLGSLDEMRADDVVVLEISSYQLEALPLDAAHVRALGRRVAALAVTNVLADHLERHGSLEAYEAAKRRLLELASERTVVVLSGEDPRVGAWDVAVGRVQRFFATRREARALHIEHGTFRSGDDVLGRVEDLAIPGEFQRENTLAALGLARALGADCDALAQGIGRLRGLEHRLQDLGLFAGHRVWDNGVSTTPDSTLAALRSLDRPLTLLCGGQAKSLPLDELASALAARQCRVVAFGASAAHLGSEFRERGVETREARELADAVREAFASLASGEELLFSPACASFDAYRNFKERALAFRELLPAREPSA